MKAQAALVALTLLAGCSPQEVADDLSRRTARTVVYPVANLYMPGPQAEKATDCIIAQATPDDLDLLMRDVGTRAGTSTIANVKAIARRPATEECLARKGVPSLPPIR